MFSVECLMFRGRKTIMRTTLKNMLIIVLLVLSGTMQATAVNYQNSYRGVYKQEYQVRSVSATAPTTTFQSTSAYSDQWNRDAQQSTLNSDGTVNGEAYMSALPENSIRRAPGGGPGSSPGTPGGDLDPNAQQPLGDALLPLMFLALAYTSMRAFQKKRALSR